MADWNDFLEKIRVYPKLLEDLNPPCSLNYILTTERYLGLTFPVNLKNIYLCNNGQRGEGKGLFKK